MKCILVTKKTKIETILDDGSKISIVVNGNDLNKIKKFFHLLEMLNNSNSSNNIEKNIEISLYDKIYNLIKYEFGRASFNLTDLYRVYYLKYNEELKKSTLSTYLSRMVETGVLEKSGKRGKYIYRYIESIQELNINNSKSI